jgi:ribonuclease R
LVKLKLLSYMSGRIGEEMDAVVSGVENFGLFAQGLELPAEGLIRVDALMDDYYQFDRSTHTLAGRREGNTFRLGDRIRVAVARVDLDRRELDFRLVRRLAPAQPARKTAKKRGGAPSPKARRSSGGKQATLPKKPAARKKATARKRPRKSRSSG